ncbi:hypothetical protein AAAC51_13035 [Priestia megaterium]
MANVEVEDEGQFVSAIIFLWTMPRHDLLTGIVHLLYYIKGTCCDYDEVIV